MISENLSQWLDREVQDYTPGSLIQEGICYRFRLDWNAEHSMTDLFAAYTSDSNARETKALVIGAWFGDDTGGDSGEIVQLLVGARHILPELEAIFFGDVISEENEISWINQSDVSPLFAAYPKLKHLVIRGGNGLSLGGKLRHEGLESLTLQSGGLPASVLREVRSMDLPRLVKLELWLGTENYGWNGGINDVAPLLSGELFPSLKHLGLRNSEIVNEIVHVLVAAPVLDKLETLDLSLGTLTDEGARHLLNCPKLNALKKLDLHHHYLSNQAMTSLKAALPNADLSQQQALEEYGPYVAVGE